ncbi:YbaK/EbsC family protein [Elioraea sp.]|jgi:prolyl-tRNA editing enzyme YbaK/EbsC (Cys-tRNA(Pro) deacylase)|uniref:YbaK/EbsC family protein n=1 Tax=Elioraea sp. TaxID=2185103 RepID=UPI0021DDED6A|nr:YbaK/EbsC family protein [Elioraea sp.]GIX11166.1 MAG: cys-tRNA(pro)/cys-tRNA(cys) deacylase [Elioraea sp.]
MNEATGEGGSVGRVRAALRAAGHADTISMFPAGTRTSEDAARAVGCTVAQIAKSLVFRIKGTGRPLLVIASGANRVDLARVAVEVGAAIERADGRWVRETTGFAIGGVAPVGHAVAPVVLIDADLMALDRIWAAAGSPMHVFETTPAELVRLTGGRVVAIAES